MSEITRSDQMYPTRGKDTVIYNNVVYPVEILFHDDQLIYNDGRSTVAQVRLELTSKSLILRRIRNVHISTEFNEHRRRFVTLARDPKTKSFGFSIKGGSDTGIPVLISAVTPTISEQLHVGDAIVSINHQDIQHWKHEQVIEYLRNQSMDRVVLTTQHLIELVPYLYLTGSKSRSSLPLHWNPPIHHRRNRNRYSSIELDSNPSMMIKEMSLHFARVSHYWPKTNRCRQNAFEIYDAHGESLGLFISKTSAQQQLWISRINIVIRNLTDRLLNDLNHRYLSHEQILYAHWIHHRRTSQSFWQCRFIVFKGNSIYFLDRVQSLEESLPSSSSHSIFEIHPLKISSHQLQLTSIDLLNFERSIDVDDFLLHYQRALYLNVYSLRCQTFDCFHQGQLSRLVIDIHHGFELYQKKNNELRWRYSFDQWKSYSTDQQQRTFILSFRMLDLHIQCDQGKRLIDWINALLNVKSFELNFD